MRRGHWCHWCHCFQQISAAEEWHQTGLCLRWKATRNEVAGALSEVDMPLLALRSFLGRSQHTRLGQATRRWQHDLRHWVLLCARSLNNAGRSGRKQRQIARPCPANAPSMVACHRTFDPLGATRCLCFLYLFLHLQQHVADMWM